MGILFSDIYKKAIALFDDPKITVAYNSNLIQFYKIMHTYLQNAVMQFQNPLSISIRLSSYNPPNGIMSKFPSDGVNNTYPLEDDFVLVDNAVYSLIEGDIMVEGKIDKENRTVTFPDVIPEGQEYAVEQYYPGDFTDNFTDFNTGTNKVDAMVKEQIVGILSRLLVKSWAEEERNLLLDIRNIMQDSDFKLTSNDRILKAKNEWVDQLDWEVMQYQNRLAWIIRFGDGSRRLGRG